MTQVYSIEVNFSHLICNVNPCVCDFQSQRSENGGIRDSEPDTTGHQDGANVYDRASR